MFWIATVFTCGAALAKTLNLNSAAMNLKALGQWRRERNGTNRVDVHIENAPALRAHQMVMRLRIRVHAE